MSKKPRTNAQIEEQITRTNTGHAEDVKVESVAVESIQPSLIREVSDGVGNVSRAFSPRYNTLIEDGQRFPIIKEQEERFIGFVLTVGESAIPNRDQFKAFKKLILDHFHKTHLARIRECIEESAQRLNERTENGDE